MQSKKPVSFVLAMLVSAGAFAAIGDGKAVVLEKPSQVHQTAAKQTDPAQSPPAAKSNDEAKSNDNVGVRDPAADVRAVGTKACEQAVNAAASIGETFTQLSSEVLPKMMQTGEEFARQVEPTVRQFEPVMREFAERMRELARQMEQSFNERATR